MLLCSFARWPFFSVESAFFCQSALADSNTLARIIHEEWSRV